MAHPLAQLLPDKTSCAPHVVIECNSIRRSSTSDCISSLFWQVAVERSGSLCPAPDVPQYIRCHVRLHATDTFGCSLRPGPVQGPRLQYAQEIQTNGDGSSLTQHAAPVTSHVTSGMTEYLAARLLLGRAGNEQRNEGSRPSIENQSGSRWKNEERTKRMRRGPQRSSAV